MQLTKHWAAVLDDYAIDLAWSPDGAKLAAASAAGPVTIFQLQGGAKLQVLPGHEQGTNCLAWAPRLREPDTAAAENAATSAASAIAATRTAAGSFDSASLLLATGGQDGFVKFWDGNAGQHLSSVKLGNSWVEHIAWRPRQKIGAAKNLAKAGVSASAASPSPSPSTELFAAATADSKSSTNSSELCLAASAGRQLTFLNADGSVRHQFKPAPKTLSAIAWHPTGACIAAAYFGGVNLWDSDDFIAQKEYPYGNGIHALTWSPDGRWLVSGNQDPSVHLWIPEQDVELHMSGYEGKVKELSFDYTSRWLATSGGRDACLWDCAGQGPEGRDPIMLPHQLKTSAVAFQNQHGLLATASEEGAVMVWSPERKQPLRATIKMPNPATKLVWSPDDQYLAIGSEQGAVYVLKCEA